DDIRDRNVTGVQTCALPISQKETYLSDSHNTRQKDYAEKVIRGSIISSDNVELARTDVDEEGNETRVYPHAELFAHVVGYLSKEIGRASCRERAKRAEDVVG